MNTYRSGGFQILPPVVKNLLIINGLFFLATLAVQQKFHFDLREKLGLFFFASPQFQPYQIVTHMFMHGSFLHIFSNMFALWMFGSMIENVLGSKRFLTYYLVTGLGAALLHTLVNYIQYLSLSNGISPEIMELVKQGDIAKLNTYSITEMDPVKVQGLINLLSAPTVGASGAVFGVLLAYGMYFPNNLVYVYFAIPVKAKYFVAFYGMFELYAGISNNPGDNIAHYAHLGGMLFGFFLIRYWQKTRKRHW